MDILLIAEGSTKEDRKAKCWGTSFLLGEDTLFDAFGREDLFFEKIRYYDIDLLKIKNIVISHDHWDHIAALGKILDINKNISVFLCENGSSEIKKLVLSKGSLVCDISTPQKIKDKIYSLGEIPFIYSGKTMFEQSLAVFGEKGLSVISGCAHPGIFEIIKKAKEYFNEDIYSVIGGFHMYNLKEDEIMKIVDDIYSIGVKKIYPLHCTGREASLCFFEKFAASYKDMRKNPKIII